MKRLLLLLALAFVGDNPEPDPKGYVPKPVCAEGQHYVCIGEGETRSCWCYGSPVR
jgi:hypothetical protein